MKRFVRSLCVVAALVATTGAFAQDKVSFRLNWYLGGLHVPFYYGKERGFFRDRLSLLGLGLENRLGDSMGLLSGGQRQAVSLLMATLAGMKILLLDEHTAALDPRTADFVLKLTQRIIADHGLTALMVTHSMRNALDYGTRTVMLHEGRVAFDIAGDRRRDMDVPDLLNLFATVRGEELADDSLLLG